jgi:hypothetical protein
VSEHILKIRLSELKVARIVCANCGGVMELKIDKLGQQGDRCRICMADFGPLATYFHGIAAAAAAIENAKDRITLEFVLPVTS